MLRHNAKTLRANPNRIIPVPNFLSLVRYRADISSLAHRSWKRFPVVSAFELGS
jgi:hypothetical protein